MHGYKVSISRVLWGGVVVGAIASGRPLEAVTLRPDTLESWNAYVARVEARIERELAANDPVRFLAQDFTGDSRDARVRALDGQVRVEEVEVVDRFGKAIDVPGGLVHHWRGSAFLPATSLDALLERVQHPPEHGPHPPDVARLRVLRRQPDGLTLFIRMTRSELVTVTYDTEHLVAYRRHGRARASSRSVATRIVEIDDPGTVAEREVPAGRDRGYLWRLNAYWRYEQVAGGVLVELESLALSRAVPLGLRVLVEPVIDRVARQTVVRTLQDLRRMYGS